MASAGAPPTRILIKAVTRHESVKIYPLERKLFAVRTLGSNEFVISCKCEALSPHSDDLAFSLGAALLDLRFSSLRVTTVFSVSDFTASGRTMGTDHVTKLRKKEDATFFALFGSSTRVAWLDRLDAPLRLRIDDDSVCRIPISQSDQIEVEYLSAYLRQIAVEGVLIVAPLALGGHVDHLVVYQATCLMGRDSEIAIAFYEDLPYAGGMSLEDIYSSVELVGADHGIDLEPVSIQSKSGINKKVKAISIYGSQVDHSTIERVMIHGARFQEDQLIERIWVNKKGLRLIQG